MTLKNSTQKVSLSARDWKGILGIAAIIIGALLYIGRQLQRLDDMDHRLTRIENRVYQAD